MSDALARRQDRTFARATPTTARAYVPEDVRAQVSGDWADSWLRVDTERLVSYASEGAV
jgi:hypothetical protein